ncbi:RNA polymerase sigma factor rpoD1 [Striga asiatica]|uniref:RNA polymerase sigma factor n=1 Tax=Striga asiatica TaxID=4170 RepID=A0A5A7RLL8_STRAF|nr:RNA polymerase sigma factor rpoD1 [Striga asiatica]
MSMSCLLPQFKCSPDTFAVNFKLQNHSFAHFSRKRDALNFQAQCVLSVASAPTLTSSTTLLELEELQLSPFEAIPNSVTADRPWTAETSASKDVILDLEKLSSLDTHPINIAANNPLTFTGSIGQLAEVSLGANFNRETILTSEETIINAAASEALALAKAAVRVAKDAAMMVGHRKSIKSDSANLETLPEVVTTLIGNNHFSERVDFGESKVAEIGLGENYSASQPIEGSDYVDPSAEELEFLEAQLSKSIAVRSTRQKERKARRSRVDNKSAANTVPMKSGSLSRKKRSSVQEVNYSDPLRYLRGIASNSKLLTASEEQVLSEGIQVLLNLERLREEFSQRCGGEPTFTQWAAAAGVDQKTLRQQIKYGVHCKDKMVKSNIRLVISIAKHYQRVGLSLQDLVQEGCRGLVRGAEKFDASKGFKFSTYAHWWIRQAIRKSLSDQSRTIRLPHHMVEASYKVREARKKLYSEKGRLPDDEELAEATGLSVKRVSAVKLAPKATISLDRKVGFNKDLDLSEVIADPEAETSEDLLLKQFMKQDLAKALDSLRPKEKQVVKWRFGLEDGRMMALQEIGQLMGVSRERIRQIESSAFRKLKNKKRNMHLQQYVRLQQQ